MSITTKTPTITIIQKIIGANHKVDGHTEAKTLLDHLDPKLTMAEVNVIRVNFKATIMVIIITKVITNAIKGSFKMHKEGIINVMDIANSAAEAVDVQEETSVHADMAGVVLEAIIIINTSNTTLMIMTKLSNNMALHVLYVEVTTILLNIVITENMILITSWKR